MSAEAGSSNGKQMSIYEDFQRFMFTNNIVVAAAGFSIGAITKDFITSVLDELVLPLVTFLFQISHIGDAKKRILGGVPMRVVHTLFAKFGNVAWLMFVWIATIILTFLILEYLLNMRIVRLRTHLSEEDEKRFNEARARVTEEEGEDEEDEDDEYAYDAYGKPVGGSERDGVVRASDDAPQPTFRNAKKLTS